MGSAGQDQLLLTSLYQEWCQQEACLVALPPEPRLWHRRLQVRRSAHAPWSPLL